MESLYHIIPYSVLTPSKKKTSKRVFNPKQAKLHACFSTGLSCRVFSSKAAELPCHEPTEDTENPA